MRWAYAGAGMLPRGVVMTPTSWRATTCFISLLSAAPIAVADAPCNKGYRDTTPAERARITAVLQAAKSALPPAPEGWQLRGGDDISVTTSICQDGEAVPWDYSFGRSYGRVGDYEKRQKSFEDAAVLAEAERAKQKPRIDALQAEMMAIMQKQMALNQKGDYDGAQKLQPQLEKKQAEFDKALSAGSEHVEAAGKEYQRDLEMSIAVRMNADSERPGNAATQLPRPVGALAALRWPSANPDDSNESALYLFGFWKQWPDGTLRSGTRAGVPTSGPHAVSVLVTADRERLADFAQKIDFAKIAAILK